MAKDIKQQMTRVVAIGEIEKYELQTSPFTVGKGTLKIGDSRARFTIFNKDKPGIENPHTNANDFEKIYKPGDLVYITGQDNRSYSEAKDQYYEDINVWSFRNAEEDEIKRWVFVYVGDIKELNEKELILSYTNYKNEEMLFDINIEKCKIPLGLEVGDRIKVKGTIQSGLILDYYGDGEFKTVRTAAEIKIENTAAELEEDQNEEDENSENDESGLWS